MTDLDGHSLMLFRKREDDEPDTRIVDQYNWRPLDSAEQEVISEAMNEKRKRDASMLGGLI